MPWLSDFSETNQAWSTFHCVTVGLGTLQISSQYSYLKFSFQLKRSSGTYWAQWFQQFWKVSPNKLVQLAADLASLISFADDLQEDIAIRTN